jgi:hypothetical protein
MISIDGHLEDFSKQAKSKEVCEGPCGLLFAM